MSAPDPVVVDWQGSIRAIWARRLAAIANRDGGDPALAEAWSRASSAAWSRSWEIRAVAPLRWDPHGHRWTIVLGRGDEHPPPNLVLVHGVSVAEALDRATQALEAGIVLPAPTT